MHRVGIRALGIDPNLRQLRRQGVDNRPETVRQRIQHPAVVVASGALHRKADVKAAVVLGKNRCRQPNSQNHQQKL